MDTAHGTVSTDRLTTSQCASPRDIVAWVLVTATSITAVALAAASAASANSDGLTTVSVPSRGIGVAEPASDPAMSPATGRSEAVGPGPDRTSNTAGGTAARVRTGDGTPVPGDLFLLMATPGSDARAGLFDGTPYTHDRPIRSDTVESNEMAHELVEAVLGSRIQQRDFTTAPGGGPSGGLIYTISYLNVMTDGSFTGGLRVAATGRLESRGYVHPITGIDEKTVAAALAQADVLFTPSTPADDPLAEYGARFVGELFRSRSATLDLADERLLGHYRDWGATRPQQMDVVAVRHIGDVAAYLCGAGSDTACEVEELIERFADAGRHSEADAPIAPTDRNVAVTPRAR